MRISPRGNRRGSFELRHQDHRPLQDALSANKVQSFMRKAFPGLRKAARRSVLSGSCASVASAAALAWRGHEEEGSAAGPLNGPSQWFWGEQARTREPSLRNTALGYAIHHLSANWWAVFYEAVSGDDGIRKPPLRILAEATGVTALAFAVDYGLTPKRLQPGFEKHVSPGSIAVGYAAFALGLAASTFLRRAAQRRACATRFDAPHRERSKSAFDAELHARIRRRRHHA
jgi:hypothetical protein